MAAQMSKADAEKFSDRLLQQIKFLREEAEARKERFEALVDKDQIMRKVLGETSRSPFFFSQGWSSGTPGSTITYTAGVSNPDSTSYSAFFLFGYLLFGPANFIAGVDNALLSVDSRWPSYARGISVPAGGTASASFPITIPSQIQPGIYIGNCFLVRRGSFDVGAYFDRAAFDLTVL